MKQEIPSTPIKPWVMKQVRARTQLSDLYMLDDEEAEKVIGQLVTIVNNQESYSLQHLAMLLGNHLSSVLKLKGLDKPERAELGVKIIEGLEKALIVKVGINVNEDTMQYSANVKTRKEVNEVIVWGDQLKPYTEPVKVRNMSVRDLCHKDYWKLKYFNTDVLAILNEVKFKLDNDVLNSTVDMSFYASDSRELEEERNEKFLEQYRNQELYIKHFIDARGRIYSSGYYINPQGTKWKKAQLTMINNEPVTEDVVNELKQLLN